jgi:hypothetical protein
MFLSVDGGRSRIPSFGTSQGHVVDVLQLGGSRFQTSGNTSQGATMSSTFLSKSFFRSLHY